MNKLIRDRIKRVYVADAIYFVTAVTKNRQPLFKDPTNIALLRQTIREVKEIHPFEMRGYGFLLDHFHVQFYAEGETAVTKILHSIKRNFTLNYKRAHNISEPISLWQKRFWDHVIRDERDYLNHLNYIHYNPVKHGLVMKPEDYPHTSYHEYLKRGWYEIGWGHVEPEELKSFDFE
ncbi:MAG: transposase [Anaerolineales bacterium]|nr:transposase [Anaerolineales bacterium]MCB8939692.1 transposase [Ardenticatenaceae bacterium]